MTDNFMVFIVAAAAKNRTVVISISLPLSQSTSSPLVVESDVIALIGRRPTVERAIRLDNDAAYSAELVFRRSYCRARPQWTDIRTPPTTPQIMPWPDVVGPVSVDNSQ
jgi:hypothetical protein